MSLDLAEKSLKALPEDKLTSSVTSLDANSNALTALPEAIGNCSALEELLCFANQIKTVPKELANAKKLKTLNLFNNKIMKLPPELGQLSELEEVNLAANKMMQLPKEIFTSWSKVKILSANDNNLVKLGSLAPLVALQELRLFGNNLEAMPEFDSAPELEILEIHKNRISEVPADYFTKMPGLKRLVLNTNMLTTLPESISACTKLQQLQVAENKLTSLPDVAYSADLETLFVQDNPDLTSLPKGLTKCAGMKRCNPGKAGPADLTAALKKLSLDKPDGIFWEANGTMVKNS